MQTQTQRKQYELTDLLTPDEVADIVRVHVETFRRWCREGKGPRSASELGRFAGTRYPRYSYQEVCRWAGIPLG